MQTARIRGFFSACTRPVSLSTIVTDNSFHASLFYGPTSCTPFFICHILASDVLSSLIKDGRIAGSLIGGGGEKVMSRGIMKCIFYGQTGYLHAEH